MKKSTITTIIVVVIIVIVGGFYFWSMGNNPSSSSVLSSQGSQGGASGASVGANELALLNQVSSIKINPSFFTSSIFLSLIDMVQQVHAVNVGNMGGNSSTGVVGGVSSSGVASSRPDPFASVPGGPSPFPSSQSQSSTQAPTVTRTVGAIK